MKPYPKPTPKEKSKPLSVAEFRRLYGKSEIKPKTSKSSDLKKKKSLSAHQRFYQSTAWKWFSRYIKLKHSDHYGACQCATCSKIISITDGNTAAGHCIRVFEGNNTYMATALDERNVQPQCYQCNRYYGGRPEIMRNKIDSIHGPGTYTELLAKSKQFKKYTDTELKEIATKYRKLVYELLEQKRHLSKWWVRR